MPSIKYLLITFTVLSVYYNVQIYPYSVFFNVVTMMLEGYKNLRPLPWVIKAHHAMVMVQHITSSVFIKETSHFRTNEISVKILTETEIFVKKKFA